MSYMFKKAPDCDDNAYNDALSRKEAYALKILDFNVLQKNL